MDNLLQDVEAIQQIAAIPRILKVIASLTGMRFVTVARVTDTRWIACDVLDLCNFGIKSGDELPLETTLCVDVRASVAEIVIDDTAADQTYASHCSPAAYGYRSYASFPIILADGSVFGTLCAVDPEPRSLKGTPVEELFRLSAELISFNLSSNRRYAAKQAQLDLSEALNASSQRKLTVSDERFAGSQADLAASRANFAGSQEKLTDALAMGELREQFIAVLGHDLATR